MKKLFIALLVLLTVSTFTMAKERFPSDFQWNGYAPLTDENGNLTNTYGDYIPDTTVITDGTPSRTYIMGTGAINDLAGFLLADKGCTLTVYPLPVAGSTVRAKASTVLTIGAGGVTESEPWKYSELGTPRAEIVITKTEAGDMTAFNFTVRGR